MENNSQNTNNGKHSFYKEQEIAHSRSSFSKKSVGSKIKTGFKIFIAIFLVILIIWGIVGNSQYSNTTTATTGLEYYRSKDDTPGNQAQGSYQRTYEHKGVTTLEYDHNGTYHYSESVELMPHSFWMVNPNYGLHELEEDGELVYTEEELENVNTTDFIINVAEVTDDKGNSTAKSYSYIIYENDSQFRSDWMTLDWDAYADNLTEVDGTTADHGLWVTSTTGALPEYLHYEIEDPNEPGETLKVDTWSKYFDDNETFDSVLHDEYYKDEADLTEADHNNMIFRTEIVEDEENEGEYITQYVTDSNGWKSLNTAYFHITPASTDISGANGDEYANSENWVVTEKHALPTLEEETFDEEDDAVKKEYIDTQVKLGMNEYAFIQGYGVDENYELIVIEDNERVVMTFTDIVEELYDMYDIQADPADFSYTASIDPIHDEDYYATGQGSFNDDVYEPWLRDFTLFNFNNEEAEASDVTAAHSKGIEYGHTYIAHANTHDNIIYHSEEQYNFIVDSRKSAVAEIDSSANDWGDLDSRSASSVGHDSSTLNAGWTFLDTNQELIELVDYSDMDDYTDKADSAVVKGTADVEYFAALQATANHGHFWIEWADHTYDWTAAPDKEDLWRMDKAETYEWLLEDDLVGNADDMFEYVLDWKLVSMYANDYRIESTATFTFGTSNSEAGTKTYEVVISANLKGFTYEFENPIFMSYGDYYIAPENQNGTTGSTNWAYSTDEYNERTYFTTTNVEMIWEYEHDDTNGKVGDNNRTYSKDNSTTNIGLSNAGLGNYNDSWVVYDISWDSWTSQWDISGFHFFFVYPAAIIALFFSAIFGWFTWGGWGVLIAIMLTVFTIRFVATLFTLGSAKNQAKMNEVQAETAAIKAKYAAKYDVKNDQRAKNKQNQEIQALYKKYEVNPMASLSQVFITLPIFLSIWTIVRTVGVFKIAHIGTITFAVTPLSGIFGGVGLLGIMFYVLFLFLVGYAQFLSTRLPIWYADKRKGVKTLDEDTKAARKKQFKTQNIMVGVFVFIAAIMPLLVGLYWLFTALYTVTYETVRHIYLTKKAKREARSTAKQYDIDVESVARTA